MPQKPAAVYLTSPDYLGEMQDIKAIAAVAHKEEIPLLVDNAHGSYLHFLDVPMHPIDLGADLCCDSAHKTLPALTGCAYLHISRSFSDCHGSYSEHTVRRALSAFGSTSPSYLLLESLDYTNLVLASRWKKQLSDCIRTVNKCRETLAGRGWEIPAAEPLKLVVHASASGYSGTDLANLLRRQHIECEYADPDYLVLMTSPFNTEQDFNRLLRVMGTIPCPSDEVSAVLSFSNNLLLPEQVISIRNAFFSDSVSIPVEQAANRVCADPAISCPPAIPAVVCGERIPEEMISVLQHYGISQIDVVKDL